jgi:response regulator RpfG family c-di-GMP phosphodiesterase
MSNMVFASPDSIITTETAIPENSAVETWKIIISDDDKQVHQVTKLALRDFTFVDRKLEFISAYTADETIEAITKHPDCAILLQDVVMETDDAGLKVIKHIREVLKNNSVRIILRTGQPGQAPEGKIIVEYDINDYKEKTELTLQKLFTLMHSSLRSYRDIIALEQNKVGLQKIIDSTAQIFARQSVDKFISATLDQLSSFLYKDDAFICDISKMAVKKNHNNIKIISAIGEYANYIGKNINDVLDKSMVEQLVSTLEQHHSSFKDNCCITYFSNSNGDEMLLCLKGHFHLTELEQNLVDVYIKQVSIIYDNLLLYNKVEKGQQEIINLLGTSIETRSKETGNHVKRVSALSCILANKLGLDDCQIETLKLASPLHDLGKIGIADAILNKPAKLDDDEWHIMQTHSQIGYEMLKGSECDILQAGALISLEHHEKWDGSGYPQGKKGDNINIFARITAIADVFDALACKRCYKEAWPMDKVIDLFIQQRGIHFDPQLVDILLSNKEEFIQVLEDYKD